MKKDYQIKCTHKDCKNTGWHTYSNKTEYLRLFEHSKTWTCVRHTKPDEVLSLDSNKKVETLFVKSHNGHNYWQKESDLWTEKLQSGFIYGNGYKAYASDFKEGTKLTVTSEITEPIIN